MKPRRRQFVRIGCLAALLAFAARADEHFDSLKIGSEIYSNVTVTSVSATDVFFTHARGMGNVKLKDLDPAMQKHFGYNTGKAAAVEKSRAQLNAEFHQQLLHQPPAPVADDARSQPPAKPGEDFVAPKLWAKSVRGLRAPAFVVERWLTDRPDASGKFLLIDFWATWCGPCRRSIPGLNEFSARFKNRLVVVGVSDEPEVAIRKMSDPRIDYAVASDPQGRMSRELEITGIPHCILVDPRGIVRYEGNPTYLDDAKLQQLLDKYGH